MNLSGGGSGIRREDTDDFEIDGDAEENIAELALLPDGVPNEKIDEIINEVQGFIENNDADAVLVSWVKWNTSNVFLKNIVFDFIKLHYPTMTSLKNGKKKIYLLILKALPIHQQVIFCIN